MYKIRPPYSLLVAVVVALYNPILGALAGVVAEILFCGLLFWKLQSTDKFQYESFTGQLLSQMTVSGQIDIWDILNITMGRISSYLLTGLVLASWSYSLVYIMVGSLSPWWFLLSGITYLYFITHHS